MSRRRGWSVRRGLSLVEAMVSIVIVGVVLTATLNTVGMAQKMRFSALHRSQAMSLAQDMMDEILPKRYEDPGTPTFGRETGEGVVGRVDFDDVDDFADWSQSPPQDVDGNDLAWADGYQRRVYVEWLNPDLTTVAGSDTGLKRIRVRVLRDGKELIELVSIRAHVVAMEGDL
jgi:MSHA pilin protein MshD